MPKNWKTQFPAMRKSASTTMHAIEATSATRARPVRETPSVKATNDGMTASGLTIVSSVVKERRRTLESDIAGEFSAACCVLRAELEAELRSTQHAARSTPTQHSALSTSTA